MSKHILKHYRPSRLLHSLLLATLLAFSLTAIAEEEKLTLNFTDTDINAVITAVAVFAYTWLSRRYLRSES